MYNKNKYVNFYLDPPSLTESHMLPPCSTTGGLWDRRLNNGGVSAVYNIEEEVEKQ